MSILDFFMKNEAPAQKEIGKVECSSFSQAVSTIASLMGTMGMTNPAKLTSATAKGIKIVKRGNTYVITLLMFTPPVSFTWTGLTEDKNLPSVIAKIMEENKKIASMNTVRMDNGTRFLQLGVIN